MNNEISEVLQSIITKNNYSKMVSMFERPSQGQFIMTGETTLGGCAWRVGYCLQIRTGFDDFKSEMTMIRIHDGSIIAHENQIFYTLDPEQEALARSIFKVLPEAEDFKQPYNCPDRISRSGFMVDLKTPE